MIGKMQIAENLAQVRSGLPGDVTLVAVSKTHPAEAVREAYEAGQRVFGENRPQELVAKYEALPKDIEWHMIGTLQTNKVKYLAPFVTLIHSVDSARLAGTVHREALKHGRVIDVLLEVRIAAEETKHGWDEGELLAWLESGAYRDLTGIRIRGLMGMASFTEDRARVRREFRRLKGLFDRLKDGPFRDGAAFDRLSMGMSGDYGLAVEEGSNMVRIGSRIFGQRETAGPAAL